MQIALVDNVPEGGAKRVVFEQIKYLSQNHRVYYYTNTRQSVFPFETFASKVFRAPLEFKRYTGIKRPLQELQYFSLALKYKKLTKLIGQSKPDVLIVHPCMHTQAPLVLLYTHVPTLYYVHEPLRIASESDLFPIAEKNPVKKLYESLRRKIVAQLDKLAVAKASTLACNSAFTQNTIESYYHRTAEVIHPGVDTSVFFPRSKKSQYFLFIGEKESINGYDLLTAALKKANKNVPIKFLEFKSNSFAVSDADLAEIYRCAYATLCLSKNEPFGLTAIESMACGTPVIAVTEGGYTETVTDETGILIKPSSEELKIAMQTIIANTNQRKKMSAAGVKHVEKNFNWRKHGVLLEKLL